LKIQILLFVVILLFIAIFGCGQKMPLPSVKSSPESFGANDTSYIRLNLVWDAAAIGYSPANQMTPVDIAIGDDGYIFVADSANDQVVTLSAAGFTVTSQNLNKISPVPKPKAIDIDAKLNLLIVNGTNTIYVWNQYLNNIGVDSVLVDVINGHTLKFSGNQALIDSVLEIQKFYTDEKENSSFQGIAFGPSSDSTVFVTDSGNNRILELKLRFNGVVKLKNRYMHPTFAGFYSRDIATYGSGAGTVDNPRGITVDENGSIYFTQLGGNFSVQKLVKEGASYVSKYTLYQDPIMDLNRFAGPCDITLDANDAIFVLDTQIGKVYKFFNKGEQAGRLANLGKTGLVDAVFNQPLGIAISNDNIIYVADTRNHRIERFQLSVSENDLPVEQPTR
jgi:hypothetical protein